MKIVQMLFLMLLFAIQVQAQSSNFHWVRQFVGNGYQIPAGLTVDFSGNIISTGAFAGPVDFDPGFPTYYLAAQKTFNAFISKLNAQGNFVWAKSIGDPKSNISANSVCTDSVGNVYVTGDFFGDIDFDPGPLQYTPVSKWGGGYVLKLDPAGNFLWVVEKGNTIGRSVAADKEGSCYFTGDSAGYIFISKLDAAGNFVWNYHANGVGKGFGASVACGKLGNVYVTGIFDVITDFDPATGASILTPYGNTDAFVLKLSNKGTVGWARQISGTGFEVSNSIVLDEHENNYTTGNFSSLTDFDPNAGKYSVKPFGYSDCFINKLNASGNFVWSRQLGGSYSDANGRAITIDGASRVCVTGNFSGKLDTYTSLPIDPIKSYSFSDAFISMSDSSGKFFLATHLGGLKDDVGISIAADAYENIYTTGCFQDTADFEPGPAIQSLVSLGFAGIFIHKMNTCLPQQKIIITSNKNPVCIGDNVTLNATGAQSYTWHSGVSGTNISAGASSFYYVYGTDNNGCRSYATLTQSVDLCSGIENHPDQSPLTGYPNPTSGDFYVIPGFDFTSCFYEFRDSRGQLFQSGVQYATEKITFDFSDQAYSPGVYFLRLDFGESVSIVKVVVYCE